MQHLCSKLPLASTQTHVQIPYFYLWLQQYLHRVLISQVELSICSFRIKNPNLTITDKSTHKRDIFSLIQCQFTKRGSRNSFCYLASWLVFACQVWFINFQSNALPYISRVIIMAITHRKLKREIRKMIWFTIVSLQSAGIRSPTPKWTTSPGTKSFANTSAIWPSLPVEKN